MEFGPLIWHMDCAITYTDAHKKSYPVDDKYNHD